MRSIAILRAEHDVVLAALDTLDEALAATQQGATIPRSLYADLQRFLATFVDRNHHWKEEAAIFPRLRSCCTRGAGLVQRLEAEHHSERRVAREFAAAVSAYDVDDAGSRAYLIDTARRYSAAIRRHIAQETEEMFPAMEHSLAEEDQAVIDALDLVAIQSWRLRRLEPRPHRGKMLPA